MTDNDAWLAQLRSDAEDVRHQAVIRHHDYPDIQRQRLTDVNRAAAESAREHRNRGPR